MKYAIWCIQSFGEIAKIRHMVHMVGKELNGSTNPQTKTSSMDTRLDFTIKVNYYMYFVMPFIVVTCSLAHFMGSMSSCFNMAEEADVPTPTYITIYHTVHGFHLLPYS